jgi:DNA-binding HxlR family transcriptional regulator
MKKKCLANQQCPLARGYNVIGDWWSLLIVTQISLLNLRRFGDLQQSLGMARNILTARLKKLVEEGILNRLPASDGSAFHEYVLTPKGRDLYKVIVALRQWGEKHFCDGLPPSEFLADRAKKQPIPPLEVRSAEGRILGADDLVIEPRSRPTQTVPR